METSFEATERKTIDGEEGAEVIDVHARSLYGPLGCLCMGKQMRWLVGLRIKPHRVWATSGFEVTLRPCSNRPSIQMLGTGITTLTFMRP